MTYARQRYESNDERKMNMEKQKWMEDYGVSYGGMIESYGYEVVGSESFGDYQGDAVYILRDGERFGLLVIGYGSCSGCDALEAAMPWYSDEDRDWTEVQRLRDDYLEDIRWFDSKSEMLDWYKAQAGNQWYYHDGEINKWILAQLA